jgi:hypothetical protein
MPAPRLLLVLVVMALVLAARGDAETLVIRPDEAGQHVGEIVTVEGDVTDARIETDGFVLDLAPGDPKTFRIVLVLALISNLPRHPERLYIGRRIRVTAPVKAFRGRAEMIVQGPDQIEVVDVAAPPGSAPTTTTLPPPAPRAVPLEEPSRATPPAAQVAPGSTPPATVVVPRIVPPPAAPTATAPPSPATVAPAPPVAAAPAPPPPAPAAAPVAPTAPATIPPSPPTTEAEQPLLMERIAAARCESARAHWREAAAALRARTDALRACLDEMGYQCRERAAALAPALTELEWAEQQVADRCD